MMNERIQELAEQTDIEWLLEHHPKLEKFAQLIVQECVTKCDEVQTMYGQFTFTARKCKEAIQQHFGVSDAN